MNANTLTISQNGIAGTSTIPNPPKPTWIKQLGQCVLVAVLAIFGVPALWLLGKSPIGAALIHRITHGSESPELLAEVDDLRVRLAEVEDRLDFAERQLTAGPARTPPAQQSQI